MDCPRCGAPDQEGRFCARCGAALAGNSADAPAPTAPVPRLERRPGRGARLRPALLGGAALLMTLCVALLVVGSVPDPVALGVSAVAAVVPAVVYGRLILRLDRYEVEPTKALLAAFGWGAVGAVLFSVLAGLVFQGVLEREVSPEASAFLASAVGAPLLEESFKGVALLAILVFYRHELDNVLDGLVYGALVGLGFAMTENILYFGAEYLENGLLGLTQLFVARAVIGGIGHAAYTASTGAAVGWARQRYRRGILRFVVPVLGWAVAVLLHALWNGGAYVVAVALGDDASVIAVVLVLALIVLLPSALVLWAIARLSGRRQLQIMRDELAGEVEAGALTPAEYRALADPALRQAALREANDRGGRRLREAQRHFFHVAAELAFRKYHLARGEAPKPGQEAQDDVYRAELARLRGELAA